MFKTGANRSGRDRAEPGTLPGGTGGADGLAVKADYLVSDFRLHDCSIYCGVGSDGRLGACC